MVPASVVSIFVLAACIGFLLLSARLFMKYSKLSRHSRFDLYPIPTEGGGRAAYGGSYLEEDEWWNKERTFDHASEIKYLINEMIFIKKLIWSNHDLFPIIDFFVPTDCLFAL